MSEESERIKRLTDRFDAIARSCAMVTSPELAFAAKMAAWGQIMDTIFAQYLEQVQREPHRTGEFSLEIGKMLQTWHIELCEHIGVDHGQAIDLVDMFREVMKDMLAQRG